MKSARFIAFALAIACTGCLGGCSTLDRIIGADDWKEWTPTTTSIQVHMDGSLTETIFDRLDQSWYEGNELQDMIARSQNEYNAEHGNGSVSVSSYSDAGGDVKVVIQYRTGEDFAAYNNTVFCAGSMLDAQMQGFLFPGPFYAVEGVSLSGDALPSSEPLSHKEYWVVISDGSHVIQVPGEIRYVSEGTQMINTHTASMDEGLRGEGAPEDSFYLIYEKDEELYLQPGTDDQ